MKKFALGLFVIGMSWTVLVKWFIPQRIASSVQRMQAACSDRCYLSIGRIQTSWLSPTVVQLQNLQLQGQLSKMQVIVDVPRAELRLSSLLQFSDQLKIDSLSIEAPQIALTEESHTAEPTGNLLQFVQITSIHSNDGTLTYKNSPTQNLPEQEWQLGRGFIRHLRHNLGENPVLLWNGQNESLNVTFEAQLTPQTLFTQTAAVHFMIQPLTPTPSLLMASLRAHGDTLMTEIQAIKNGRRTLTRADRNGSTFVMLMRGLQAIEALGGKA